MNFLLDTCVLSEIVKVSPNPAVVEWVAAQDEHRLFLSVITIGELHKGIARLASGSRRETLRQWLDDDLQDRFRGRVLGIDSGIAREWGTILAEAENRGRPLPAIDALIAASAKVHTCAVVTRNVGDFEPTGVEVVNPWDGSDTAIRG